MGLRWLVRMRWGALASQAVAIGISASWLGIELPAGALLGVIALAAATNLVLGAKGSEPWPGRMTAALLFDIAALTALLALSGGPSNPFSVVYLVYVTLGAVLLPPRHVAGLVVASSLGYAVLFGASLAPGDHSHHAHHGHGDDLFSAHLYGMYVALVVSATLVGYFVSRLAGAVRAREAELRHARAQAAHAERLAALTTLCAGAAHELGTPLGTIALAASELGRAAGDPARTLEDAELIRAEVARCRAILDRMAARFGEAVGEHPDRVTIDRLFDAVRSLLPSNELGRVAFERSVDSACLPLGAVAQTLANLIENALDAGGFVEVRAEREGDELHLSVRDDGAGMTPEVLGRATDPFFTTKEAGRGMGLGLYLSEVTALRLGGALSLTSEPGEGTTVVLSLPDPAERA
ncbi:MAG: HAMP domain-containing histidine kinase [Polyangiaceae bacterium]|nr:HAMP domain-containing histidine kinase [Polyangiaceae bacterium]